MKTITATIILFAVAMGTHAQLTTNEPAHWQYKLTRFDGKIDSSVPTSSDTCSTPEVETIGTSHEDKETTPGHECDLKWEFIGRNKDKDVYHFTFTRMTKSGSSDRTTTFKDIQFDGKQVVVFEDALHTVVMKTPEPEDLKTAGQTQ
jgi:hypothetical protein